MPDIDAPTAARVRDIVAALDAAHAVLTACRTLEPDQRDIVLGNVASALLDARWIYGYTDQPQRGRNRRTAISTPGYDRKEATK